MTTTCCLTAVSCGLFLLVLLACLGPGHATDPGCFSRGFSQCSDKNWDESIRDYQKFDNGVRCPAEDGGDSEDGDCVDRKYWCTLEDSKRMFASPREFCRGSYANLHMKNCLTVDFSIEVDDKTFEYKWIAATAHWEIAEMYCQTHEYNLLSFSSKKEFTKLHDLFNKASKGFQTWVEDKNGSDPIGQRCQKLDFKKLLLWTGLFYNRSRDCWNYTDSATEYDEKIGKDKFQNLKDTLSVFGDKEKVRVLWQPVGGKFEGVQVSADTEFMQEGNPIHVLCKRQKGVKFQKWGTRSGPNFKDCLSGYNCKKEADCNVGPMFKADRGQILDGKGDCKSSKDDEDLQNFPHLNVSGSGNRRWIFVPFLRSEEAVQQFCKTNKLVSPSIHKKEDKDLLLALPDKYAASRDKFDLSTLATDFNDSKLDWYIRLHVDKNDKWEDGTVRTFDFSLDNFEPAKLAGASHVYLSSSGDFETASKKSGETYIVCQEGAYSGSAGTTPQISMLVWLLLLLPLSKLSH